MKFASPEFRRCMLALALGTPLDAFVALPAAAQAQGQSYLSPYATGAPTSSGGGLRPIDHTPRQLIPLYEPSIWQGLYLGALVGGDFGSFQPADASSYKIDIRGFTGGAHLGYNWQINNFVTGFEIDATGKSTGGTRTFTGPLRVDGSHDWLTSIRLRLGYLVGNTLIYGTAGYAVGNLEVRLSAPGGSIKGDETMQGFVVGGGIESKLAPNLTGRLEGLHYGFAEKSFNFPGVSIRGDSELTTVRAGLTYHFN